MGLASHSKEFIGVPDFVFMLFCSNHFAFPIRSVYLILKNKSRSFAKGTKRHWAVNMPNVC